MCLACRCHRAARVSPAVAGVPGLGVPGVHGARVGPKDAHYTGWDECIYGGHYGQLVGQARAGAVLEQCQDQCKNSARTSARTVP